jgi:hypothetical protein
MSTLSSAPLSLVKLIFKYPALL